MARGVVWFCVRHCIGRPASNNNNNSNSNYGHGYGGKKGAGALDGKKKHAKNESGGNNNHGAASEKRFKTLPASEALPRNEPIGGYIFVCNNDTMEENLKRQLFGMIIIPSPHLGCDFFTLTYGD